RELLCRTVAEVRHAIPGRPARAAVHPGAAATVRARLQRRGDRPRRPVRRQRPGPPLASGAVAGVPRGTRGDRDAARRSTAPPCRTAPGPAGGPGRTRTHRTHRSPQHSGLTAYPRKEQPVIRHRPPLRSLALATAVTAVAATLSSASANAALSGASTQLTRAAYLSDITASSVQVTWATTGQNHGVVKLGPPGNCAARTITASALGSPITVNGVTEYRNSLAVTGLSAGTAYCYRVYTDDATPVDLLGSLASPQFTTLDPPASAAPFTFAVLGDWGDTTNSGVNDGTLNANQAAVDAQIAASGARFAISTGDVGYPGGTQTNYGDLNQTGVNISAVFGAPYWAVPGRSVPLHGVNGNHGQNSTFINVWPQSASAAA